MSWLNYANDVKKIRAIFGGELPVFESLALDRLQFGRDGRVILLLISLRMPVTAPRKWQSSPSNALQLAASFGGVYELAAKGNLVESVADLGISIVSGESVSSQKQCHLRSSSFDADFLFGTLDIRFVPFRADDPHGAPVGFA